MPKKSKKPKGKKQESSEPVRLRNFSYIKEGVVAGSGLPGDYNDLEKDLEFLKSQGIVGIITLTVKPLDSKIVVDKHGFRWIHLPVPNFGAPDIVQIDQMIDFVETVSTGADRGKPGGVVVHCHAGMGRTGVMLACFMIHDRGMGHTKAIKELRKMRPGSIENAKQEKKVMQFAIH